jgi:hypothetical protein
MIKKMLDKNLINLLSIESECWEEILREDRENFTLEFRMQVKDFIRKIIVNTECGNLHSEKE